MISPLFISSMQKTAGGGGASSGNVTWTSTSGVNTTSPDIFRTGGVGYANSVETIDAGAGHDVYFQVQPPTGASSAKVGGEHTGLGLMPSSGAPYTTINNVNTLWTGQAGKIRGNFGGYVYDSTETFRASELTGVVPTDIWRIGFDSSGHFKVWQNGANVWTSSGTFSGTHILLVVFTNDGGENKLRNVSFQQ